MTCVTAVMILWSLSWLLSQWSLRYNSYLVPYVGSLGSIDLSRRHFATNAHSLYSRFPSAVDLPLYFPRDQPTLTFQSIYHFSSSGQLYSQVQKSYPYSPRWDGNEMAKRAKWVRQAYTCLIFSFTFATATSRVTVSLSPVRISSWPTSSDFPHSP